jgi:hypothetical protein
MITKYSFPGRVRGRQNWAALNTRSGNYNWEIIETHFGGTVKKKINDDGNLDLWRFSARTEQYSLLIIRV